MGKKSLNLLLAENLAAELKAQKLSARALGDKAEVSPRTIGNYLNVDPPKTSTGKDRSATLHAIDKIAAKLKISPLALLIDRSVEPVPLSDDEAKLLDDYRRLPPQRREQVAMLADSLQPWQAVNPAVEAQTAAPKPARPGALQRPGA